MGVGGARWLGRAGRRGGVRGWREVLGGEGKGAAAASLRWHAVAGGTEELRRHEDDDGVGRDERGKFFGD